eukprot:TRINITY_DN3623_c0_g1_i1.p1 TRINITY_DN3623_c0_g1~~TRINITY_DN3623_c0_g1_i1.p1  ORF type:complete len:394 (-),score=82.82 TRINITY_DN3623_c0_g1_i1:398-1558(-)
MATLVAATEADQFIEFARYVAKASLPSSDMDQWVTNAVKMIEQRQFENFALAVAALQDRLVQVADDKDVEAVFNVYFAVLTQLDDTAAAGVVRQISSSLAASPTDKPLIRLKLFSNLFNHVASSPKARLIVLLQMIQFAGTARRVEFLLPVIGNVEKWLKEWACPKSDIAEVYLATSNLRRGAKEELEFLQKYLALFSAEEAQRADICSVAQRACVVAITQPGCYRMDHISELPAIQALAAQGECANLLRLLQIFTTEPLSAFLEFAAKHKAVFETFGISEPAALDKMRLLSLASVGSAAKIPYSTIAQTLQISDADVERWVIRGISAKLVEAQIDQLNKQVTITRTTQRVFGNEQWHVLATQLRGWREDMTALLTTIRSVRNKGQ